MVHRRIPAFLLFFLQFYLSSSQGIYTEFGQNRVQYQKFKWLSYRSENANLLYSDTQLKTAVVFADKKIAEYLPKLEKILGYKASNLPYLMVYGSLSEYRQNNIGYVNPQWHSGGITFIPAEAIPVYYNGDYATFGTQIQKGLCDFMIREMIYGGTLQDRFQRLKSPPLPFWFTEGLSLLIAEGWNAEQETALRDGLLAGTMDNYNFLNRDQQLLLGRSIWKYIIEKEGTDVISGIMFIARYTHSAEAGISYYFQKKLSDFLQEWKRHCSVAFENRTQMVLPKGKAQIPHRINKLHISAIDLNEDGKILSLITHDHGKFSVWLYSLENYKVKKIYEGGQKILNQITDYSFPKAKWKGNRLFLLTFEKGEYKLITFTNHGKTISRLSLQGFQTVNDFALHPQKDSMVFSGVRKGNSDLYKSSILGGSYFPVTQDSLFENNVVWINDSNIIYTSGDALNIRNIIKITHGLTEKITHFEKPVTLSSLVMLNDTVLAFLSDKNGLQNAWIVNIQSVSEPLGLTNYARSIAGQAIAGNRSTFAELLKIDNQNTVFTGDVNDNPLKEAVTVPPLEYTTYWKNMEWIEKKDIKAGFITDTITRFSDTLHDIFKYQTGFPVVDYTEDVKVDYEKNQPLKGIINNNPIVPDYIVTQIDNKNLGSYLFDNSVPAGVMRNPWLMPYVKISLSDLQKNALLEAGARSSLDLTFTDFHFKAGLYARRLDHEFSYFRRSRKYDNAPNLYQQYGTQLVEYRIMLPVDERIRYSYTAGWRQDVIITKITEKRTDEVADQIRRYWLNRFDILFDNSISSGLNQIKGSKVKFGLNYMIDAKNKHALTWAESDLRFYTPIWKSISFAQRVAGAYNIGRKKIGYYLGGVENWTQKDQVPNNAVFLNPQETLFQAWVCNLRGFSRGARMGHSYLLSNSEIRFQFMKLFYQRPIASEFLKHLTITAFADAGCAFTGNTPADIANPYNTRYISTPNYTMSITSRRNPWLLGMGYGIRSRVLGYFVKYDRARGLLEGQWERPMHYISLGLDF
jgi:hypothetical protein